MNRVPKGSYTKELREQSVKLVLVDGLSQREVAGRLSLSVKTLGAWVVAEQKGTPAKGGETQKPQGEQEAEELDAFTQAPFHHLPTRQYLAHDFRDLRRTEVEALVEGGFAGAARAQAARRQRHLPR